MKVRVAGVGLVGVVGKWRVSTGRRPNGREEASSLSPPTAGAPVVSLPHGQCAGGCTATLSMNLAKCPALGMGRGEGKGE